MSIQKDKKCYSRRVNRLVAEEFIAHEACLTQVNHKDENKLNNHADNLEWCTPKYNCNYGSRTKKISQKKSIKIKAIDIANGEYNIYPSIVSAAESLSVFDSNIAKVLSGKRKHTGGYIFEKV